MLTERAVETKVGSDYKPPKAKKGGLSLHCTSCGTTVELALWQPVVRCPHCEKLVYPDRSLRNLLPLGWNCLECGTLNDGLTNFCLFCGAGLASRCLACETPVTGPICLKCGEHQAHLRHLKQRGLARASSWVPIQRERIQHQVDRAAEKERKEFEAQAAAAAKVVAPPPAPPLSDKEARREARRQRRKQRGQGWGGGWWIWMIVLGGVFMSNRMGNSLGDLFNPAATPPTPITVPAWAADGTVTIQEWWSALVPALNQVPALSPSDPEYTAIFAAVLLGIAGLPMLLFLVDRVVKRLVP